MWCLDLVLMCDKYCRKLAGRPWESIVSARFETLHYGQIRRKQAWAPNCSRALLILALQHLFFTRFSSFELETFSPSALFLKRHLQVVSLMSVYSNITPQNILGYRTEPHCCLCCAGGCRKRSSSWGRRLSRPSPTLSPSSAAQRAHLSSFLGLYLQVKPLQANMWVQPHTDTHGKPWLMKETALLKGRHFTCHLSYQSFKL